MKKAILTIGLFTLVLASTSFAAPTTSNSKLAENTVITPIDGNGGQNSGGWKKVDVMMSPKLRNSINIQDIDGNGGQNSGGWKKVD